MKNSSAREKIDSIRHRLMALVDNRGFVFKETRKDLADKHLAELTAFSGLSESDVQNIEQKYNGKFSQVFREYLTSLAINSGELFKGGDLAPGNYSEDEFKEWARELFEDRDKDIQLKENSYIFLFHQGYVFNYIKLEDGEDSSVYQYMEGDDIPKQIYGSFFELLESELNLMEENNKEAIESGGYFLMIDEEYGVQEEYPALARGRRPLDIGDVFE